MVEVGRYRLCGIDIDTAALWTCLLTYFIIPRKEVIDINVIVNFPFGLVEM